MTVRICGCSRYVYELATPDGTRIQLDPGDHPDGAWVPEFDGRTAHPLSDVDREAGRRGHRVHDCHRPIDGQVELFGGDT